MTSLTYEYLEVAEPEEGIIEFTVLPEHITLLRNQKVEWKDGLGQVNATRPYGTREFHRDMARILEEDEDKVDEDIARYQKLHAQTALVLQIILKTGKFKATTYRAKKFSMDWKEYNPALKGKRKKDAERAGCETDQESPEGD